MYARKEDAKYRWLLGFPIELVEELYHLLVTTPYWGSEKDCDDGNFWLWLVSIRTDEPKLTDDLKRKIDNELRFRVASYNMCAQTILRWREGGKKRE